MDHYLLGPDGQTPEPFDIGPEHERLVEWMTQWEAQKILAQDQLPCGGVVSTIFLGMDMNWLGGPPLLFETMCWDAANKVAGQWRRSTYHQIMRTHQSVLQHVAAKAER